MKFLTPASVRQSVLARDSFACIAPLVDQNSGQCHDRYGRPGYRVPIAQLQLDHVRDEAMMGRTAPADPKHLVTLCPGHHLGAGERAGYVWATCHRPELRDYLRRHLTRADIPIRTGL